MAVLSHKVSTVTAAVQSGQPFLCTLFESFVPASKAGWHQKGASSFSRSVGVQTRTKLLSKT